MYFTIEPPKTDSTSLQIDSFPVLADMGYLSKNSSLQTIETKGFLYLWDSSTQIQEVSL